MTPDQSPDAAAPTTNRPRPRRVLAVCGALLIGLALAELSLQIVAHLSPRVAYLVMPPWDRVTVTDSALGFRLSPYAPGHDRWGFRNDSVPPRADLVSIGDSFTYGFGALPEASWPQRLAALTGLTVYNAGVGGYGPCEYAVVFDRLLSLEPKTVVLGLHTGNDLGDAYRAVYTHGRCADLRNTAPQIVGQLAALDAHASLAELAQRRGWDAPEAPRVAGALGRARLWLARHSMLYALARSVRYELGARSAEGADGSGVSGTFEASAARQHRVAYSGHALQRTVFGPPEAFAVTVDLDDQRIVEGLRITERVLTTMNDRMRARGGRFLVAIVLDKPATFAPVIRELAPGSMPPAFYRLAALEERVASDLTAALLRHGIEVVETAPAVRAALRGGQRPYPQSDDHHLNPLGYRLIAAALAERLQQAVPAMSHEQARRARER